MGNLVDKTKQKNDKINGIDLAIEEFFLSNRISNEEVEISIILVIFSKF